MVSKLLKDGTVVTFSSAEKPVVVLPRASVLIQDDRIVAIVESGDDLVVPPDTEIVDVQGRIVMPGFVNTHAHMWQTVFRTTAPNMVLAHYFDALSQMSPVATAPFTPDDIYISVLEGYLEGLNAGVTSYVDHAHNNWRREVVTPGYDAAADSGARVWWCYDLAPNPSFPAEEQWDVLGKIASKTSPPTIQLGLALDGIAASAADSLEAQLNFVKRTIRLLGFSAFTLHHVGGPWPQGNTSPAKLFKTTLQDANVPVIFSHASFLTNEDIDTLRELNHFVSITPESECHYGHGQKTGRLITDQASIGVDTNCTFSGDLLSQARLWLQTVRNINYSQTLDKGLLPMETPMTVEQAFLLATRQGGLALRRDDIGVLQVGAKADIVVVNGDSPNMLGWSDPVAAVMLHANASDFEHVLVDGQFKKRDFKLANTKMPWEEVRTSFVKAAQRIQPQILVRPPLPTKLWGVGELGPVEKVTTIRQPC